MSHGNARVESGCSINKSLLQENMKNESLVAQSTVFDVIQHDGGYLKVNILQDMLCYVRNSAKLMKMLKKKILRGKQRLKSKTFRRKGCQLN